MSDLTVVSNEKSRPKRSRESWFTGESGKVFFRLKAYPQAFNVPLGWAIGSALSSYVAFPVGERDAHFHYPPSGVIPTAVDADGFVALNQRLRRLGFFCFSEKLERNVLATLRVQ